MRARTKSAILWGLVGVLSFLVVAQGYVILVDELPLSLLGLVGVGVIVGGVTSTIAYQFEHRFLAKGRT